MAQTMPRSGPQPLRRRKRELPFPLSLYQTAIGKKWVMALTGIALLGFVLVHMIGNLHAYEGPVKMHDYAETLRELGVEVIPRTWALWIMRIGLIGAFGLHIHAAITLTRMNDASNQKYAGGGQAAAGDVASRFASRTMRWTGPIVLLYLLYHLADLTWGLEVVNPDFVRGAAYDNLVASLSVPYVAAIYLVGNIALGIHLFHGAWSMFQSMGINSPRYNGARKAFAAGFVVVTIGMNCVFVVAILTGFVGS